MLAGSLTGGKAAPLLELFLSRPGALQRRQPAAHWQRWLPLIYFVLRLVKYLHVVLALVMSRSERLHVQTETAALKADVPLELSETPTHIVLVGVWLRIAQVGSHFLTLVRRAKVGHGVVLLDTRLLKQRSRPALDALKGLVTLVDCANQKVVALFCQIIVVLATEQNVAELHLTRVLGMDHLMRL